MATQITSLADVPHFIPAIAAATLEQWADLWPDRTHEWRVARLEAHLNRDTLPIAWVMHEGDDIFGTVSLRATDIAGLEHLTPWLGGLFVFPEHRGRGIGGALCAAVEDEARKRGVSQLYLGTFAQKDWFAAMGWDAIDSLTVQGRRCDVMEKWVGPR